MRKPSFPGWRIPAGISGIAITETIDINILEIKRRMLGDHDAEVLDALENISATLACLNNHVEAAKFKETADQILLRAPEADTGKPFRNGSTNATWLH